MDVSTMGNSLVTTRGRRAGEDLREESPNRWVPTVSVGRVVTGGRLGSRAEMGRGVVEAGRRGGKWLAKLFLFWNSFPI
jgi:hypothetical protein